MSKGIALHIEFVEEEESLDVNSNSQTAVYEGFDLVVWLPITSLNHWELDRYMRYVSGALSVGDRLALTIRSSDQFIVQRLLAKYPMREGVDVAIHVFK